MSFLDEDVILPAGQVYALISVVSPGSNQKAEQIALKIRGVFASRESAEIHVKKLKTVDTTFDVFLVECGKWLLLPPPVDKIGEVEYSEEKLNDIIKGYHETQLLAKAHFEERKKSVMLEGLDKHLLPHERIAKPEEPPKFEVDDGAAGSSAASGSS